MIYVCLGLTKSPISPTFALGFNVRVRVSLRHARAAPTPRRRGARQRPRCLPASTVPPHRLKKLPKAFASELARVRRPSLIMR